MKIALKDDKSRMLAKNVRNKSNHFHFNILPHQFPNSDIFQGKSLSHKNILH